MSTLDRSDESDMTICIIVLFEGVRHKLQRRLVSLVQRSPDLGSFVCEACDLLIECFRSGCRRCSLAFWGFRLLADAMAHRTMSMETVYDW